MPEKKAATKRTRTTAKSTAKSKGGVFSSGERAAMKELVRERKAAQTKEEAERDVLAKIAEMPKSDRVLAERIHALVQANAPDLAARTWYGMPAYTKDGKVVCFFKAAEKFKSRYATFGFEDAANLDDGAMWPTSYALTEMTAADEKKIAALVKKAAR
ncbi:MAG TPA: DUF1801 domain-containing protein [Actinomycetota bacterium]|jgi:uncharacterized protein YdhG (YjbR/CyaY superfamily)